MSCRRQRMLCIQKLGIQSRGMNVFQLVVVDIRAGVNPLAAQYPCMHISTGLQCSELSRSFLLAVVALCQIMRSRSHECCCCWELALCRGALVYVQCCCWLYAGIVHMLNACCAVVPCCVVLCCCRQFAPLVCVLLAISSCKLPICMYRSIEQYQRRKCSV